MLAPPARGSELVDLLRKLRIARLSIRHAADALAPQRHPAVAAMLKPSRAPVGVIAGNRCASFERRLLPLPHDGRVSVAATHIDGQTDHIVLSVSHTAMVWNASVHRQIRAFLSAGCFLGENLERPPGREDEMILRRLANS